MRIALLLAALLATATAHAADAPKVKLACERLLPKEALAKHGYSGAVATLDASGTVLDCDLQGKALMKVAIACPAWGKDEKVMRQSMDNGKKALKGATDLPGVGRQAYSGSMSGIALTQFWDDDTPCYVTLTAMDAPAARALVRDLAGKLTPAAIAP